MELQVGISSAEEEYRIALVPRHLVTQVWARVEEILTKHPTEGTPFFFTPAQIFQALLDAKANLWIGGKGDRIDTILLCSIVQYPAARTLEVNYVGGVNLREGLRVGTPPVERWALLQGCTHIEIVTRPAVMRLLRRYGYQSFAMYACKPLVSFNS